jgi:two-component system sensor histidine kinase PilS (NtrC family)
MVPDLEKRGRHYLTYRLLIILMGFGLVGFYHVRLGSVFRASMFPYLYGILCLYLVFGLVLLVLYPRWRRRVQVMRWQVVVDFTFQASLIWATGGVLSIFGPLLFVTLVAATGVVSPRGSLLFATVAGMFLSATTLAYGLGLSPVNASNEVGRLLGGGNSVFIISYLLGSVLAFYAVAVLGARFSHGLRDIEEIQSEILENMAESLVAVDREGRMLHVNKEARKLLGVEAGPAARPWTLDSLFPGAEHAVVRRAFAQTDRRRFTISIRTPDGGEFKISSVTGGSTAPPYRIALISDLSLKREVEAAERRIQKLEDLQVMALGIAHEIRNPLASIRGCVQEIARVTRGDSHVARYMEIVCRESDRLDRILEDFLLFARSGPVDLVPLDLVSVIEEAVLLLRSRPGIGSRTLAWTPPRERPRIFGDRNRLIQVFLNLGINAIDATPASSGRIEIRMKPRIFAAIRSGNQGREVVGGTQIEMEDNGTGIEEGDMKRMFTPFFTTKTGGNGLGLSIVDRIIREHMGVVDVASTEGRGTCMRVWFPLLGESDRREEEEMREEAEEALEYDCHA